MNTTHTTALPARTVSTAKVTWKGASLWIESADGFRSLHLWRRAHERIPGLVTYWASAYTPDDGIVPLGAWGTGSEKASEETHRAAMLSFVCYIAQACIHNGIDVGSEMIDATA